MSTTEKQDEDFLKEVIGTSTLELSIEWIKDNLEVQDVFDDKEIIGYVSNMKPDDVFNISDLEEWAESNGFTKD